MKPISFVILASAVHATCFDGNNGGCSHFCSEGVCSCPDCWTLDSDGKTCLIAPDKGNITCGASGPTIFLDKCVVPEVDQASIHLNHDNCSAVEDGTTHWKITPSSFYDCGTVVDTQERK
ncbi:Oidioi.mRNA.OKI2018_I69.chr2.g4234.t1.cds [Oikopleura dioica]|uniref:Oidioi.mRNA.OKI2018_I69.chr2.g4234.t1.cds n=1 Tax=Oikopleura dioica TaxID=34765 RepID=A0ABN7SWQ1_OIKDI|nr:Oidioi.mRNA.OKI2018_I69.chr2.g4234.t1.cds [Oikopleura dioica]